MGAGFARIPQIEQNVSTPRGPGPALSNPPRGLTAVGALAPAVADTGNELSSILALQAKHQQILDSATAEEKAKSDLSQQMVDIKTNQPPQQWASKFKEFADDYQEKTIGDPANAHIADYLKLRLPQLTGLMATDALESGAVATAQQQHALAEALGKQKAQEAAPDYKFLPESFTIKNGPGADAARAQMLGIYKSIYGGRPDMLNAMMANWDREVTVERGKAIAMDTKSAPGLMDAFAKSNNFTPEQQVELRNMRISAIEAPYHAVTAAHEAAKGEAITTLDQMAHNHDPSIATVAYQQKLAGNLTAEEYENYTHSKWRDPYATSAPGLVESYLKDIDQNPNRYSAADIAAIPADQLTPDDRHKIQAARADAEAFSRKAVGGEYLRSLDSIRTALTPNIIINKEQVEARVNAAMTSMKAAREEGQFQTVKDVQDFTKNVLASYAVGKPKQPVAHVTGAPVARFAPIPPAIAAKIAAKAAASGWEPGE